VIEKLNTFLESGMQSVEQQQQHYYRQLGTQTIRSLETEVTSSIGQVSKRGMGRIVAAFHSELSSNEEFFERWEQGDPTLITEFVNDYRTDVIEPHSAVRTSSAASTVARARTLPRGGNSSAIVPGQPQEAALDPNDEDAVHKRAFARVKARMAANTPAA